eukprot:GEMP01007427.1.p1 GENE.GEMP01007427.1~~GEMP01007427.1.p1  ORF type:complete len:1058 (+),score=242.00 GEMP01007427.1:108-3281(+)
MGGYDWRQHVRASRDPKVQNAVRQKIENFVADAQSASLRISVGSAEERNTYKHYCKAYQLQLVKLGRWDLELRKVDTEKCAIAELALMVEGMLGRDWVQIRDALWQAQQCGGELSGLLSAAGINNCSERKLYPYEQKLRSHFELSSDWRWFKIVSSGGVEHDPGRKVHLNADILRHLCVCHRLVTAATRPLLGMSQGRRDVAEKGLPQWTSAPLAATSSVRSARYNDNLHVRTRLPAYKHGEQFLQLVDNNDVVVVCGATGCGKTTQLPQMLMDHLGPKRLICTQPRRISPTSIAARVAFERSEPPGQHVGYQIRFDHVTSAQTRLLYVTTGVLLRFVVSDPLLREVSVVIVDEVHERGLHTDFALLILRDILDERRRIGIAPLKIILMSATVDPQPFIEYFKYDSGNGSRKSVAFLDIPGKTNYPIEEYWAEDILELLGDKFEPAGPPPNMRAEQARNTWATQEEVMRRLPHVTPRVARNLVNTLRRPLRVDPAWIAAVLEYIDSRLGEGGVLVFVPGWMEITDTIKALERAKKTSTSWRILPLHSMIPPAEQNRIFDPVPRGVRKIIVSTTIAETSITIEDVVFVVDTGLTKGTTFSAEKSLESLEVLRIARSNAQQRRGRAGRCLPGQWFKLYSSLDWDDMQDSETPEMLRTHVEELCLQVRAFEMPGTIAHTLGRAIAPPSDLAVENALTLLRELGALEDDEKLTPLGWRLSVLPVNPCLGKMLLLGNLFGANEDLLSVCSTLGFRSPFVLPFGKEKEADYAKMEYGTGLNSDHLLYAKVCREFETKRRGNRGILRRWTDELFVSDRTLEMLTQMHEDLRRYLQQLGLLETSSRRPFRSELLAVLSSSLHIAVMIPGGKKFSCAHGLHSSVHPSSLLKNLGASKGRKRQWDGGGGKDEVNVVAWFNRLKTSEVYIHDASSVEDVVPLLLLGAKITRRNDTVVVVQGVLPVQFANRQELDAAWNLRTELQTLVNLQVGRTRSDASIQAFNALAELFEMTARTASKEAVLVPRDSTSDATGPSPVQSRGSGPTHAPQHCKQIIEIPDSDSEEESG